MTICVQQSTVSVAGITVVPSSPWYSSGNYAGTGMAFTAIGPGVSAGGRWKTEVWSGYWISFESECNRRNVNGWELFHCQIEPEKKGESGAYVRAVWKKIAYD